MSKTFNVSDASPITQLILICPEYSLCCKDDSVQILLHGVSLGSYEGVQFLPCYAKLFQFRGLNPKV